MIYFSSGVPDKTNLTLSQGMLAIHMDYKPDQRWCLTRRVRPKLTSPGGWYMKSPKNSSATPLASIVSDMNR